MTAPAGLSIRRTDPARFDTDTRDATALMISARRATLPHLKFVHSDAEMLAWMRTTVFPRRSVRLAEVNREIVGFAARDGAWLEHLYVKPGWNRNGIGQRLLDVILAEAALVTPVLRLYTFQANAGARQFYERNGFVAAAFGDGAENEEHEPDIRYERKTR